MPGIPAKMKAVMAYGPFDYRYGEVDVPGAGMGEILVKIEACGICAGDIKAYNGGEVFWGSRDRPRYIQPPVIPGHEFVGRIVEIGPGYEFPDSNHTLKIGDRVTSEQIVPCGECRYCKSNRYWLCVRHDVYGFKNYLNGGFAEYMIFPARSRIFRVPDFLPVDSAVLIEPFACSMHAVERAGITPEDIVVISGAGPLGLGMIAAAKLKHPSRLISLDMHDKRLQMALRSGCDMALNPGRDDIYGIIASLTDGYGCDVYIEATGHVASVAQGLGLIRKAGRFVEFSVFSESAVCDWSIIGDGKELDILGSSLSPFCYPKVIEGISGGELATCGVVTHKFSLQEFKEAFGMCMKGEDSAKVVLIP